MSSHARAGGVRLRAMRDDEFVAYLGPSLEEYARFVARNHAIPIATARARAASSTEQMLTAGLHTDGHRFFVAEDETGAHVGDLWLGLRRLDGAEMVWVYDVRVDEERRGRGYGRLIMGSAEDLAREMGGERLGLNVFGDNERARRLYESLGYAEISRQMRKDLV
jgi:GNAT superfamily N-acetyltransferase